MARRHKKVRMKGPKTPVRVPTAKPTIWHKDGKCYNRRDEKEIIRKEVESGNIEKAHEE
jgi:hypothetical protein